MPKGRTALFAIWRACERSRILFPNIRKNLSWDELNTEEQSLLIAYNQIREIEEIEELQLMALGKIAK